MIKRHIIIPARLQSTRLQNKLLLEIAGKPIIEHVYQKALMCGFEQVIVATDSDEIKKVVETFGGNVCMTRHDHQSGTDRLAEAAYKLNILDDDIIVNIQGDEPLIPVENVIQAVQLLVTNKQASMATLCEPIIEGSEIHNPNCVKVVFDQQGYALYFSRAPIPWQRGVFDQGRVNIGDHYRHIGLYAYRAAFLKEYALMTKSPLEQVESLEQLRVLWHGKKIAIAIAKFSTPPGVDTQADLDKVRNLYERL
ncbi:3-deoxy-manno-octulosonate cytidylyltransferase [Fastidiosibacter lacustris]|uniref:3-deoxy-manno-octulosonate cytidylyltransferase n=1 Tax=Fastidiosibacter lacustris TaxID=2056695 RepID=UPI000E3473A8|nr:3-deoxy-manno-octulosonate cytidylyltransferase [Fastidiosibacter lacustris]